MPGTQLAQVAPVRQGVTISSSLNAVVNAEGAQSVLLFITSVSSLTGVWEGTNEDIERLVNNSAVGESGADWFDLPSLQISDAAVASKLPLATITPSDDDVLAAATLGAKYVRFRRTVGSGTGEIGASDTSLGDIAAAAGQSVSVTITQPDAIVGPGDPTVDSYTNVAINLEPGADQVIVASAASKQIWVYGYHVMLDIAGSLSIQDEDNTAESGIMPFGITGGATVSPSGNFAMPILKLATDKDLEFDVVTADLDGWLAYAIISV